MSSQSSRKETIQIIPNFKHWQPDCTQKTLQFFRENLSAFRAVVWSQKQVSTNHALIDITNRNQEACVNGQYACGIYVDFKKAFDTVNHNILLEKLANYGVRGIEHYWFKAWLNYWFKKILLIENNM